MFPPAGDFYLHNLSIRTRLPLHFDTRLWYTIISVLIDFWFFGLGIIKLLYICYRVKINILTKRNCSRVLGLSTRRTLRGIANFHKLFMFIIFKIKNQVNNTEELNDAFRTPEFVTMMKDVVDNDLSKN